jgi:hypothetical protein
MQSTVEVLWNAVEAPFMTASVKRITGKLGPLRKPSDVSHTAKAHADSDKDFSNLPND